MQKNAIETRRFETPDQSLDMKDQGGISIVKMAEGQRRNACYLRARLDWETDEKPLLGSPDSCPMRHVGYCISGKLGSA